MALVLAYIHYQSATKIIGVYTDMTRAKRAVMQADYPTKRAQYIELDLNDGVEKDEQLADSITMAIG